MSAWWASGGTGWKPQCRDFSQGLLFPSPASTLSGSLYLKISPRALEQKPTSLQRLRLAQSTPAHPSSRN